MATDDDIADDLQPNHDGLESELEPDDLSVLDTHTQNKLIAGSAVSLRTVAGMLDLSVQALQFTANRCPEAKTPNRGQYDLNALLRHKLNKAAETDEGAQAKAKQAAAKARSLEADANHKEMVAAERAGALVTREVFEETVLRMAHVLATCLNQFPNRHADELLNLKERIDVVEVLSAGTHAALVEISAIAESALLRATPGSGAGNDSADAVTEADGGHLGGHAPDAAEQHSEAGQVEIERQPADGANTEGSE